MVALKHGIKVRHCNAVCPVGKSVHRVQDTQNREKFSESVCQDTFNKHQAHNKDEGLHNELG